MSLQSEQSGGDLKDFKWGRKRGVGVKNKAIQFYESFVYEGVKYSLYDCAYFYDARHVETSIGKLVRMYEGPSHNKMVKVVWFLRPGEIRNFMGHYRPSWDELFLASGVGKGVSNLNYLGAIIGKCNVVCTSKDRRNPEPSDTDLKKADYFFDHTFDVGKLELVDKFADKIDGIEVEHFFNRKGDNEIRNDLHVGTNPRKIVTKTRTDPSDILPYRVKDKAEAMPPNIVLPEKSSNSFPFKKRKIEEEKPAISPSSKSPKEEEFIEKEAELIQDKTDETCSKAIEVTERPGAERRKWFKKMPWEERLQRAEELDTLVLLDNLDPSFTSSEVEDLVWHAFQEKVEARMIEQSPSSNPYYGRALVIFKTKDAAKSAIFELNKRCLVLGEGRVLKLSEQLNKPKEDGLISRKGG
ncbi:protein ANTI-SILENCING 1 isoform X2 [Lotus japonicus]|uniref:protein ANTI-SILENCING 1 isoform X2 n=1 Tax=Lotus japonicus TaxID=34305 RepID=UPI00258883D1|nr:protein ANTI-SILENCING 1 isoform X2 [Lotus japonicus]